MNHYPLCRVRSWNNALRCMSYVFNHAFEQKWCTFSVYASLLWRQNERHGVSNYRRLDYLFNGLCRWGSKKTSKRRGTGLCEGNSPVTGEFPSQRASNAENVSIWWRHHESKHDVQFSCAIYQPLLAHHWRVHQCLLTSRFIAPSIPWGVSAPGGKMWKQLLKDRIFLNNSPIFTIEISAFIHLLFKKHCIQYISI